MAQVGFEHLTEDWTPFTDIETPVDDQLYFIQNRGPGLLLAQESAAEPTTEDGVIVEPYKVLKYIKGTDTLYLRAFKGVCSVNVTTEG